MSLISGIRENLNQLQTSVKAIQSGSFAFKALSQSETIDNWNKILTVDASGGNIILTLPSANGSIGLIIQILKIDTSKNTITIVPSGGTINGLNNFVLYNQYDSVIITSNGSNCYVFSSNEIATDGGTF